MEEAPESIASTKASVSLLRMQSISCLWVFSTTESVRRKVDNLPAADVTDFGNACLPSNRRTKSKSTNRMVSNIRLSSPPTKADSMASDRFERNKSLVMIADPRHNVESNDIAVDTDAPEELAPAADPEGFSVAAGLPPSGVSVLVWADPPAPRRADRVRF